MSPPMGMHTLLTASAHAAVDVRLLLWTKTRPGMQARAMLQSCTDVLLHCSNNITQVCLCLQGWMPSQSMASRCGRQMQQVTAPGVAWLASGRPQGLPLLPQAFTLTVRLLISDSLSS